MFGPASTSCPTAICNPSIPANPTNFVRTVQNVANVVMPDSMEVDVNLFYIIDFGARLTGDGDVFFSFTPPQTGLVELFARGVANNIAQPVPFSASMTTTRIIGPNSMETRRNFFSGTSFSAGGAFPVYRGVGPFVGGIYSPSTQLFGVQSGVGTPQITGGYSMSPSTPVFTFPRLAWKKQ